MQLSELKHKKISLLGLGIENESFAKYLLSTGLDFELTICDFRTADILAERMRPFIKKTQVFWRLGEKYNEDLEDFDILLRSPGWPLDCPGIQLAKKKLGRKLVITSAMQLFLEWCPTKHTIGVTGSKGKGTTSSLIAAMLKEDGKKVWLGGNIGLAPFDFFEKITSIDWVVLELSSFQLEQGTASPHIGVITNFTREHLAPADPNNPNYHKTMGAYWNAKWNIAKWQNKNDWLIANQRLTNKISAKRDWNVIFTDRCDWPSKLLGIHNQENAALAVAAAKLAKLKTEFMQRALAKFKGLEYRIEFIREIKGIKYYNDSFATTPDATITALKSFAEPIVLLAGGADKKSDFKILAKEIKKRTKFVIIFNGEGGKRIYTALTKIKYPKDSIVGVNSMKEAVAYFKKQAKAGDIVLLSTACASFGIFKSYKDRGKQFTEAVKKLNA
ncbi:MAG: UDP-N-acetylmuramoyl-L-alanine--D-glutamate ligase [Candidatus Falkowbacteria bacterium]